ncbi:hypothetical protein MTO96_000250 [Rhipicephalus appendiculatus]
MRVGEYSTVELLLFLRNRATGVVYRARLSVRCRLWSRSSPRQGSAPQKKKEESEADTLAAKETVGLVQDVTTTGQAEHVGRDSWSDGCATNPG